MPRNSNHTRQYPCTFQGCSSISTRSSDRARHARTHLPYDQRRYKCDSKGCPFRAHQRSGIVAHKNSIHLKLRKECHYPNCTRTFSDPSTLSRHINKTHKAAPHVPPTKKKTTPWKDFTTIFAIASPKGTSLTSASATPCQADWQFPTSDDCSFDSGADFTLASATQYQPDWQLPTSGSGLADFADPLLPQQNWDCNMIQPVFQSDYPSLKFPEPSAEEYFSTLQDPMDENLLSESFDTIAFSVAQNAMLPGPSHAVPPLTNWPMLPGPSHAVPPLTNWPMLPGPSNCNPTFPLANSDLFYQSGQLWQANTPALNFDCVAPPPTQYHSRFNQFNNGFGTY